MSSSSPNLPEGAFITSINGKRCTAVPRSANNSGGGNTNTIANNAQQTTTTEEQRTTVASVAVETTSSFTSTTSTSSLEENDTTSTTSSTSTSTSTSSSSTSTSTSTSIDEAQETDLSPLPAAAASPDDSFPPVNVAETTTSVATSSLPQFSVIPTQAAPEASVIQTSKADTSITATSAISAAVGSSTDVPLAQSELTPSVADATPLFTTIGTAKSSSTAVAGGAAVGDSNSNTGTVNAVPSSNGRSTESTIAVAGGVIGGVAVISLIAFLIWFWRRRTIRKRRSTLLTPLSVDPSYGPGEKAGYNIDRGSIGPTPRTEKLRAALGANLSKLRGRFSQMTTRSGSSTPSVNMNRGNSQFMEPVSTHSRHNSSALPGAPDNLTAKDRFMDWWSHLTADIGFKWKMRNPQSINSSNDPFSSRGMSEKKAPLANKPDFLTLLNMDDGELDREAQRRRASRMKGSGSSAEHFLGGLSLNFGDDPFSDSNAIAHQSAKPAPLTVSQANNPFSDANAIPGPVVPKPSTYVADIRRSRGQSVSGPPPNSTDPRRSRGKSIGGNRPPSNTAGMGMYGRESTASVDSFATRRNKFRSDPFDLERPELLSRPNVPSSNVSTAGSSAPRFSDFEGSNSRFSNGVGMNPAAVRKPVPTHSRRESYSSKYSSGISMGDWSDPGPDVGPAANRWDSSTRSSPTEGWRNEEEQEQSTRTGNGRRQSQGSQRSVGKAL